MSKMLSHYTVEVGKSGRVTLPSKLRKAYGIKEGDRIKIEASEKEIKLKTAIQAMQEIQDILEPYFKNIESPVDDFLAWRREEAAKEEAEYSSND